MTVIIFFFSLCLFSTSKNTDEDDKQTNHQQTLYIFPLTCLWLYVDSGFSLVPPLNFDHNKYIVQKNTSLQNESNVAEFFQRQTNTAALGFPYQK